MTKGVKTRAIVIACVLLLVVYGIIGLPKNKDELRTNLQNNIHLGLDLKGGSHLVLQVQVQDAVKAEADRTIETIKDDLRKRSIDYTSIDRNDPQTVEQTDSIQINIHGVPAARTGDLRDLVTGNFPSWTLTPVNSSDYKMTLKPTELIALKKDTVTRSIQTIENRINGLGLTDTRRPISEPAGGGDGQPDPQRGGDQGAHRGQRPDREHRQPSRKPPTWRWCCARARCRPPSRFNTKTPWGPRWAPIPSTRASWPAWPDWRR
jgi:hypothetical protein